jgi:hypothetical protein
MAGRQKTTGKKDDPSPEFGDFQRLLKQVLSVPKEEVNWRRAQYKSEKDRKKPTG